MSDVDDLLRTAAADLTAEVRTSVDTAAALRRVETSPPQRGRRLPLLAAAVLLVVVAVAVVVATDDDGQPVTSDAPSTTTAPPGPTTPGPATGESEGLVMTVDRDTGLVDGDRVEVTAEGLPTEHLAGFVMCRSDALVGGPRGERCQLGPAEELQPDPDGRIEGSIEVDRILAEGDGPVVDCAREVRCAIGAMVVAQEEHPDGSITGTFELRGLIAVDFARQAPLADPTVRVTPADGLRHGEVVTIEGEGFRGPGVSASFCLGDRDELAGGCAHLNLEEEAAEGYRSVEVDADGRFSVAVRVWRMIPTYDEDGDPTGAADCAVEVCTLAVMDGDEREAVRVPLGFDPSLPVPVAPTLTASPTTGLRPGDPVTITVRGLAEGQRTTLAACSARASEPSLGFCSQATSLQEVVGEADGEVVVTIAAVDPAAYGVDCTRPATCGLEIMSPSFGSGDPLIDLVEPIPMQYGPP